jgi:hypothetical protein
MHVTPKIFLIFQWIVTFIQLVSAREMENKSTVEAQTSGICHCPHRGVDVGHHSCKTTEYQSTDLRLPSPPLLNVTHCVIVPLWTVKTFLAQL